MKNDDTHERIRQGNWIPVDANLAYYLPVGREYSVVEAMVSLQANYDRGTTVTISGLASSWGWSIKKVRTFLKKIGMEINYGSDTKSKQNQRGYLSAKKGTDREQIGNRSDSLITRT